MSREQLCRLLFLACIPVAAVAATASFLAIGQHIIRNDEKLLRMDDQHRISLIARTCSTHGQLWQRPDTGEFACIYSNPSGETLVQAVTDIPTQDDLQTSAHVRTVARR